MLDKEVVEARRKPWLCTGEVHRRRPAVVLHPHHAAMAVPWNHVCLMGTKTMSFVLWLSPKHRPRLAKAKVGGRLFTATTRQVASRTYNPWGKRFTTTT